MQRLEGLSRCRNAFRGGWLAARCVDQSLQLSHDRHWPERSDPAATRVAMGQPPERRLHGGSRDPKDLSHDLADVVLAHGPPQHEPVDPRVQPGRGLTEHVRALETCKRRRCIAQLLRATGGLELGLDGRSDAVMEIGHEFLL